MGFYGTAVLPRLVDATCGSRALEPLQRRLVGGCHLTRPIAALVTAAGFTITELDVFYQEGIPKVTGADSLGVAVAPPPADAPH